MIIRSIIALLLGAILTTAFAPWQISIFAILIPMGFIFLCDKSRSIREAIWLGFVFGLSFFACGVYWIYYSIYTYGQSPLWLAYFLMMLLCAVLALFPALLAFILRAATTVPASIKWLGLYPAVWTLLEGIRAIIGSGFPWLSLGYSQTASWLNGYAPILGVYGLSFLCVFISGLLYLGYRNNKIFHKALFLVSVVFIYGLGFALSHVQFGQDDTKSLSVALVQGDVEQTLKWTPGLLDDNIKHYIDLTDPYWQKDLIIWPEAAIPANIGDVVPALNYINNNLQQHNSHLLTGIIDEDDIGNTYNALILLGQQQGIYYKRHLVPFGEYLPLKDWLSGLLAYWQLPNSSLSSGPKAPTDLVVNNVHLAPFICYEIIFPGLVRESLPRANVLVTISDDSWFGDSIALTQHLQMAQMRSIEMARPQLFVSNSGITAIIDHQGNITSRLPTDTPVVLEGMITPHSGVTPFILYF